MNLPLRIFCMAVSCLVFYSVFHKLVKRQLNESNSILWLLIGLLTMIAGFFPDLITNLAIILRIDYPPTLLFLISTIVLMLICFKSSIDISKAEKQINETAIVVSLLKEDNRRLQELLEKERMQK